jgi:predicted XRE-type DNA-binding protein
MTAHWRDNPLENTEAVIGTGNFLADRGYADPEEARVKFELANRIGLLMEDRNLRQADVCALTGLKQPDVSRIVNGNVSGFSVWRLLQVLKSLGETVTISVSAPAPQTRVLALSV